MPFLSFFSRCRAAQVTTSSEDRETICLDDIKFSPGDHNHNGRDRDLLDRHLDSLSMSSSSSACSALSWDSSPSVSCTAFILKKEPSEDLEEDEEHEVRAFACHSFRSQPHVPPFSRYLTRTMLSVPKRNDNVRPFSWYRVLNEQLTDLNFGRFS